MYKKFRIKIIEKHNNRKIYVPQVKINLFKWENILNDDYGRFDTSSDYYKSLSEEPEAIKIIEEYKQYLIEVKLKSTKKTSYKYL